MARPSTDLDDVRAPGGRDRKPRPSDIVEIFKFPQKKWTTIRLFGPLYAYGGYWIATLKKDGNKTSFYTEAPSFDPATKERDSTIFDPWRDAANYLREQEQNQNQGKKKNDAARPPIRFALTYYGNAIIRADQKKLAQLKPIKPTAQERKTGFKDKDSDTLTPVKVVHLSPSLANKIKELSGLNTRESRGGATKAFPVSHEKFGCDIRVYYDPDKPPADQYQVVPGNPNALTEKELAYLKWDCSELAEPDSEEETRMSFKRWAEKMGLTLPSSILGGKKKKKVQEEDDEDEDADGADFDEDDDDDEPKPKGKKKPAPKSKKKPSDDEDDFDDDEDEESEDDDTDFDDDDEDEPKSKKPVKKPAAKSKKPSKDDDFDEDEEDEDAESEDEDDEDLDEDEDDDFDEPKSKKKPAAKKPVKKPAGKKKPADDDFDDDDEDEESLDDDDDDFDEDEDEDEDEPKSKKKPVKKPAPKGKKKPADDDFEDEDEDEDADDLDEEDEEPPKSKKKPAAKKPAGRRK